MEERPVICAYEATEVGRHATQASRWLASSLHAPLVLAHAFDPMGIPVPPRRNMVASSVTDEDLERSARQRARRQLTEAARTFDGHDVTTELPEGPPVRALLDLAAARNARLLVAGTAARAGVDRILVGSVTSELASRASCPVVTVPPGAELEQPGPVLAGYDGSEHSLRAARHGSALAAQLDRDLVLVHVAGDRDEVVELDPRLADELYAAAAEGPGADPNRPPLELKVSLAVEEGDPAQVLSLLGRERRAPLIVVGSRGRNALTSALLGSVSASLVRTAGRPVVVVSASAADAPAVS